MHTTRKVRVASALVVVAVEAAWSIGSIGCGAGSQDAGSAEAGAGTFGDGGSFSPGAGGDAGALFDGGPAACASSFVQARALPLMLVFMFDRSGSMGDEEPTDGGAKVTKWQSCVNGLSGFFGDPASAGIAASLQFFMLPDECNAGAYAVPDVPMTPLPAASVFDTAFAAEQPDGETPTVPALEGALALAAQTARANPGAKVAVVFVTDGEPNGCSSTIAGAAGLAAGAWNDGGIPTYVVGIGKVKSLDEIADAGGTGKAFVVSTTNPAQTAADLATALGTIRGTSLGCDFPIPAAPAGMPLDFGEVNVVFTPAGGPARTLLLNASCNGAGWRYDDPSAPTKIVICPETCPMLQAAPNGSVQIELGCATLEAPR
jgi:hypothetical protein